MVGRLRDCEDYCTRLVSYRLRELSYLSGTRSPRSSPGKSECKAFDCAKGPFPPVLNLSCMKSLRVVAPLLALFIVVSGLKSLFIAATIFSMHHL